MSIKSTRMVSRETAVNLYASLKAALKRRKWVGQATTMTNDALGDALDRLAEEVAVAEGTTCFTNYSVTDRLTEELW